MKRGIHSDGASGSPSQSKSPADSVVNRRCWNQPSSRSRQVADDGVVQRRQRLADGQQKQFARLAGHEDELAVALDQLAHHARRGDHQFQDVRAGQQLVGDRVAVPHPPDGFRTAEEDRPLGVIHDGLPRQFAELVARRAVVEGGPLAAASSSSRYLLDRVTRPCCRRSRRKSRCCHVP